ncbi:MAG: glycosyltransferase [Bacteroidetes bacterium]|nr:glycosyltransferase [Bacteroidota bacterium]
MKPRVAILIHGGVGTGAYGQGFPALELLINGLANSFDITIYSQHPYHPVYRNAFVRLRTTSGKWTNGKIRWFLLLRTLIQDHRLTRYHLIFSFWGYPAGVLAVSLSKLLHIRSGICLMGADSSTVPEIGFGILHKQFIGRITRFAYYHSSLLMCMSHWQKEILHHNGWRLQAEVVPWGPDTSIFHPRVRKQEAVIHILHVAHLTPVKDPYTLLRTFSLIRASRPAVLRIVGEDLMRGKIQEWVQELAIEDQVQLLGARPHDEMCEHYQWADILLQTSISEGFAICVVEAFATGIPVAGTRVGLLADLGEQFAVVAEPGEEEKLASGILSLLNNEERRITQVDRALSWVHVHNLRYTIEKYKALWYEVCATGAE